MDNKIQTQAYTTFLNRTEKRLYTSQTPTSQPYELQQTINKTTKSDYLEKKLISFERKLEEFAFEERKREMNLGEACSKLKTSINEKVETHKAKIEKKATDFIDFYQSKVNTIQAEVKDRKTIENNVLNRLDDRYISLRHEIQKIAGDRLMDLESLQKALEIDIPRLNDRLITEGRNTEDFIEDLKDRYAADIGIFRSGLEDEVKANDEHDQAVYNMLEEINEKMKHQLLDEKIQRRACEESMFALLEEACKKINAIN